MAKKKVLTNLHLKEVNDALAGLENTEHLLDQCEQLGNDCSELREQRAFYKDKLNKIRAIFYPNLMPGDENLPEPCNGGCNG